MVSRATSVVDSILQQVLGTITSLRKDKFWVLVLLSMLIIFLIKAVSSMEFQCPWVMYDAATYDNIARNIWRGSGFVADLEFTHNYPPLYPLCISICYLLTNKMLIYQATLGLNALISSLILMPAFLILREFTNPRIALLGAILVAVNPANFVYTYTIMSENLFNLLFLLSAYFIFKSEQTPNHIYTYLSGISVFLLIMTKDTGWAMVLGFSAIVIVDLILVRTWSRFLRSFVSFGIPYALYLGLKHHTNPTLQNYNTSEYFDIISLLIANPDSWLQTFALIIREVDYLILATFIIFFVFYVFLGSCRMPENLKYLFMYVTFSVVGLIGVCVTHISLGMIHGNPLYTHSAAIIGRYLDPGVSLIVLLGIIGIYHYFTNKCRNTDRFLVILCIMVCVVFYTTFPSDYNLFTHYAQILPIVHLKTFSSYLGLRGVYAIYIALCLVSVTILVLKSTSRSTLFILIIYLLLSLGTLASIYSFELDRSNFQYSLCSGPLMLVEDGYYGNSIVFDSDCLNDDWWGHPLWYLASYWTSSEVILGNASAIPCEYLITSKLLPNVVMYADSKIKIYDMNTPLQPKSRNGSEQRVIHIGDDWGVVEGVYHDGWTNGNAKIKLDYPACAGSLGLQITHNTCTPYNPHYVNILLNGNFIGNYSSEHEIVCMVDESLLDDRFQILEIISPTWNPSEHGLVDKRELGLRLESIEYGSSFVMKS